MIEDVVLSIARGALIVAFCGVVGTWIMWTIFSLVLGTNPYSKDERDELWLWRSHRRLAYALFWPPVVAGVLLILWGVGEAGRHG